MNNNKNISKDSEKHKTSNKTEIHSSTEAKSNASANQTQIDENQNQIAESEVHYDFSADNLIQEAERLKIEACRTFESSKSTAQAAKVAQEKVDRAAARANIVTNEALRQEVEGQRILIQAGQKLMEAGAKLQEEACQVRTAQEAELSFVQKGSIQQNTTIEVPKVQASEMHVLQNRVIEECRPVVDTQVRTERIEAHTRMIQSQ
uniref:Uncharacterized protein n=1 Tax=Acrobeloides nanus TaxID=290746 RepID=A0A914DVW2_9BILA